MESGTSSGFDIGPDIDRRGLPIHSPARNVQRAVNGHGGMNGHNSNSSTSDLDMDDLEEDTPSLQQYIRQRFPQGNVIGMPGVYAYPVYEPLDESPGPLQTSMSNGEIYQNGRHASDSSLDEMARGTSPWVMEARRLRSFCNWPYGSVPRSIKPEDLAKDGFRYVGPSDTVQCVFCLQRLKHWEEGDSVRGEHERFKPNCPLITGQSRQNVPLTEEERSAIVLAHLTREEVPRSVQANENENSPPDTSLEAPRAKHPQFSVEATRLATFQNWPTQMHQKPEDLSKAGFFYLNSGDMVCCFFCGETVVEWEKDDDPWVEHAVISPSCYFVKMVKGEDFIQMAKKGVPVTSCGESDSVETLLEKPACLALLHDGYSKEQVSVALTRMIHRQAGPDVYRAAAIKEELDNIDRERAVAQSRSTAVQGAAANPVGLDDSRDKGVKDLEEENKHLKEQRVCKVCLDNEINIIFLPCGHLVCCASCGLALSECPVCRQAIVKTTKAYWA